jgi:hypothetical protein
MANNTQKHRFIDFSSRFLRRPEDTLWVLRPIRVHEASLPLLRPNRSFECPECMKCFRMAFRPNETSLHQHHISSILRRSEGRFLLLRVIRLFKTWLKRLKRRLQRRWSQPVVVRATREWLSITSPSYPSHSSSRFCSTATSQPLLFCRLQTNCLCYQNYASGIVKDG